MKKITNWFASRSNAFKAAFNTAWQSFLATFTIALVGFLGQVQNWVDTGSGSFPSVSPLGKAAGSAAVAAAAFLITYAVRSLQAVKDPLAGPQY